MLDYRCSHSSGTTELCHDWPENVGCWGVLCMCMCGCVMLVPILYALCRYPIVMLTPILSHCHADSAHTISLLCMCMLQVCLVHTYAMCVVTRPVHTNAMCVVTRPVHTQAVCVVTRPVHTKAAYVVTRPVHTYAMCVVTRPVHIYAMRVVTRPVLTTHVFQKLPHRALSPISAQNTLKSEFAL